MNEKLEKKAYYEKKLNELIGILEATEKKDDFMRCSLNNLKNAVVKDQEMKRNIKLLQEKLKKYEGVRQRKQGKWTAEVRVLGTKDRIWIGTFNTIEEASLAYDKTVNEMKGAYTMTNILKPPPRYPSPTEINYMNPPSSSIDNARI
ncbi:hypothetical protein T459_01721 [Capsicum annuum]|uniref:AP2/ERF domain-containing protein n=1 Tax=Capsicum annuum TaxID=4072 RepID=A0A2G3AHX8_CAPAN|nr:hypothetical protein T459_01721 [Capsicum annuum]